MMNLQKSENKFHLGQACNKTIYLQEIRIWCLQTTRSLIVLTGHRSTINSLHFSPNDDYLTTSGNDGLVCFWPVTGTKSIRCVGSRRIKG